jgi:MFS family permease
MTTILAVPLRRPQAAGASIALIALALLGGASARTVLSPLQELMRSDLVLTDNQVSLIQGAAMALPLAVVSVPIGRLVDRASRTRLLIALAFLCAAGSALTALAHGFTTMILARMLVGISVGGALPAAVSLGADLSLAANRGKVIAVLGLGQVVGTAGAFLLAGSLLGRLPVSFDPGFGLPPLAAWRLLQLLFSLGMLVLALALFMLREPPRQEVEASRQQGLRQMLGELARHRGVLLPLIMGMLTISMADAAANVWAVPVLTRALHLQPADFGGWMGLLLMAAGLVGVVSGGLLGDFGQRLGGRAGLLGAAALVAALSTPMACFPLMTTVQGFATLLGLLILFGAAAGIIGTAAFTVVIPNELRGFSLSLVGTLSIVVAFGVAPTLVSFVAQVSGYGDDIRVPLTAVGLVTSIAGVASYLLAMRAVRPSLVPSLPTPTALLPSAESTH